MAEVTKDVLDKATSGVKERIDSGKGFVRAEIDVGKDFVKQLVQIKPVVAVVDLVADTVDNTGKLIKEQCEISRKWLSGLR